MKYLSFILFSLLSTSALHSQCIGIGNKLFDSTLNLVYEQAPAHGDASGLEYSIEENIYKILYDTPDSVISLERKLDILCLAIYFGKQNADPIEGKIRNKFLHNDSIVTSRRIFLLPITFTRFGGDQVSVRIINFNKDSLKKTTKGITPYYTQYFNDVIDFIPEYIDSPGKYSDDMWAFGLNLKIQIYLLRSKEFQKKYSCFNRFLDKNDIWK